MVPEGEGTSQAPARAVNGYPFIAARRFCDLIGIEVKYESGTTRRQADGAVARVVRPFYERAEWRDVHGTPLLGTNDRSAARGRRGERLRHRDTVWQDADLQRFV
jgi:hypothetical protein